VHERVDQTPQLLVGRLAAVADRVEQRSQTIERILVAGEQDLFLVLEVVVEISLLHVERGRNLLDGRTVVAEAAEGGGGALQDLDARRGFRITVRAPLAAARAMAG